MPPPPPLPAPPTHTHARLLQPGAVDVFLDFISYSGGPLPEEQLAAMPPGVPVSILWGREDPWEPVGQGRELFAGQACVEEFVELPGVGHCPQVRRMRMPAHGRRGM